MSWGVFTDKELKPSDNDIDQCLRQVKPLWDNVTCFVEDEYNVQGEFKFYGKNLGWALRYKKSGRVLIALYPGDGEYTVQIILNEEQIENALSKDMSIETRRIIVEARKFREGKWVYVKVPTTSLEDIKSLIISRFPLNLKK
jgi:hypothetical protein